MPQEFNTTTGTRTTHTTPPGSAEEKIREQGRAAQAQATATKHESQQAAEDLQRQAGRAAESAREGLSDAAETAREKSEEMARRAREGANSFLARQKDVAAEEISHLGDAVHRAAEKLEEEEDRNLATYAEAAASRARAAADYLKQHEVGDLLSDVQGIAHRHPAAVCGGMFVAGVALARFLKATPPPVARRSQPGPPATQGWEGTTARSWEETRQPLRTTR